MRNVIVLAGGHTVASYNLRGLERRAELLIAVNDAAVYTKPHIAFSMDRKWSEWRYAMLQTLGVPRIMLREGCNRNFTINSTNTEIFERLDTPKMSKIHGHLNGSNSGTAALNLAYQQKPERVFLLGYDMKRIGEEVYWYPVYPHANQMGGTKNKTYENWAAEFKTIAEQFTAVGVRVFNVTHDSAIDAFEKITFNQFTDLCKVSA